MNKIAIVTRTIIHKTIRHALVVAALLLVAVQAQAQTSVTDGSTPLALTPGAPAGSYALSGFDNINPYNGNLNFALPLLTVGGRGGVQHTIPLKIEQHWKTLKTGQSGGPIFYYPTPNQWEGGFPGYSPGVMNARLIGTNTFDSCASELRAVTRLTFTAGDGTEYEFHDARFDGQPFYNRFAGAPDGTCHIEVSTNRGRVFVTSDGSAMTFISDTDLWDFYMFGQQPGYAGIGGTEWPNLSGYMLMRDGTRYRIEDSRVMWIQDRNGNRMTFTYNGNGLYQIIDSLNRVVTIRYAQEYTDPDPHTQYDEIIYQGFGGATRSVKVWYGKMNNYLRETQSYDPTSPWSYAQLFPSIHWADEDNKYKPRKIVAVELPDGRQYQFLYNVYGELARVVLPTGGAIEYDYDAALRNGPVGGAVYGGQQIYRRVTERRVYVDGGNVWEGKMTYSRPEDFSGGNDGFVEVAEYGYPNTLLARSKHYYFGSTLESLAWSFTDPANYSKWQDGKEWKIETYDNDVNGTIKRRVTNTWQQRAAVSWWTGDANLAPPNDPRIADTTTKLLDISPNLVSQQIFSYDQFNNKTDVDEYDFGPNTPGGRKRRTHTNYVTTNLGVNYTTVRPDNDNPDINQTIHLRGLPLEQLVYEGSDLTTPKARTTYEYDAYTAGLTDRSNITGHARMLTPATYTTSYLTRGNVTKTTHWLTPTVPSNPVATQTAYDIAGNVVSVTDPLGRTTTVEYLDRFGTPDAEAQGNSQGQTVLGTAMTYAFATKVTSPAPFNHTAYTQFDYYLGKPVNGQDANGIVNSGRYGGYADASYSDVLDRPTEMVVAVGTGVQRRTRFQYNDAGRQITTTSDQVTFADGVMRGDSFYDGLGRTVKSQQTVPDAGGVIISEQKYDGVGRKSQASNPYRPGDTVVWTTTGYDGLGRVKTVTTPDGAMATTSYLGNQTTVIDQASKQRRSFTDALGRLTQVDELQDTGALYATTTYQYDVLDDLVKVVQGSQNRYFMYDALKRLVRASNPEQNANAGLALVDGVTGNSQWSMGYSYDANGNLTQKVDGRNVTTSYTYDELNRAKTRSYTNDPTGTPTVTYSYDGVGVANAKGRLTQVSSSVSVYNYTAYDALGQVLNYNQQTAGQTYLMSCQYNLAGAMTSETYPSGRVVTTSYDTAGRLSGVSGSNASLGEGNRAYLSQMSYTAHGATKAMQMGNSKWEHAIYNTRLQPIEIGLGVTATDASLLKLEYGYGATTNNGNVLSQTISLAGLTLTQCYGYDGQNRLLTADEHTGTLCSGTQQWKQGFSYDRYGNRNFDVATTTANVLGPNPAIDTATNRINASGYGYDAAGNLTSEPGNKAYGYDGENHQVSFTTSGATTSYSYDGDGRRVKKTSPDSTAVVFVYNAAGQLIAEYDSSTGTSSQPYQTSYLTADALGSTRVVTDASGAVKSRRDYLPFGEEIAVGLSGRTTAMKFGATDGLRQQFTSKERDSESGLDYFLARCYSSGQGRFTSIDPLSAKLSQPQDWNCYIYCNNSPLRYIDPDGLRWAERRLANGYTEYHWFATVEEYDAALQSKDGWRQVHFDENKPYAYMVPPRNGDELHDTYVLNPDGTHGYTRENSGKEGVTTHWDMQFAIGGLLNGARIGLGKAIDTLGASLSRTAVEEAGVQTNRTVGNAFRDEFAEFLESKGYDVTTEVYKRTPFGKRFIDIEVSRGGKLLGGIETKVGASRYTAKQFSKDMWLRLFGERGGNGIPYVVTVVRKP